MTSTEKNEIKQIPKKYRPLTAWGYFFYQILFMIPIIGFIALIICSLSSSNIVRRSFARSYFCLFIIIVIIIAILFSFGILAELAEMLQTA